MPATVEHLTGYLRPREAANRLGISEPTLRWWAATGRIAALITPFGRLYRAEELERVAAERRILRPGNVSARGARRAQERAARKAARR